jgi:predicted ester cyclase
MSRDDNIAALSTIVPIAQRRAWDQLDEVIAPNVVDHDALEGQPPGLAGVKWYWRNWAAAFPDFRAELVVLSADEDHVTMVIQHFGTHTGVFQGHAPTGRTFSIRTIEVVKFAGGLVVERWGAADMLGLFRQLGLV